MVFSQFGKVDITIDDRLLRASDRQEVFSLKDEVARFSLDESGMKIIKV